MSLSELVRKAGVIGADGGGYPSHVKPEAKAEIIGLVPLLEYLLRSGVTRSG